jgi:hypothetical protein
MLLIFSAPMYLTECDKHLRRFHLNKESSSIMESSLTFCEDVHCGQEIADFRRTASSAAAQALQEASVAESVLRNVRCVISRLPTSYIQYIMVV